MKVGDRYMNEVIRQLHERKSVRVFTEREISKQEKRKYWKLQAFCARKYNLDFTKEMSRSVAKYLE